MLLFILTTILFFATTLYFLYRFLISRASELKRIAADEKLRASFKGEEAKLEVVYVDKLGNTWFKNTSIFSMRVQRCIEARQAAAHAEMCVTPEMLDDYIEKTLDSLINGVGKSSKEKAIELLLKLKERRTWAAERLTLEKLANAYFLLPGEDPFETSPAYFEKKKAIWAEDPHCYAFFLNLSLLIIRNVKNLSETGTLEYLMEKELEAGVSMLKNPISNG